MSIGMYNAKKSIIHANAPGLCKNNHFFFGLMSEFQIGMEGS